MQEVAAVRRAALDAVEDVGPAPLQERITSRLESGSMAPGVLTVLSARAADRRTTRDGAITAGTNGSPATDGDSSVTLEAVATRGAGVQLIYEGLNLTRTLSCDPPWERQDGTDGTDGTAEIKGPHTPDSADSKWDSLPDDATDADMAILVADIMVARGFYLLARTDAAGAAVCVVQSFGRDQTTQRVSDDDTLDRALEADVFELAAVAGTTAIGRQATGELQDYVAGLARTNGHLPVAERLFSESTVETLAGFVPDDHAESGVATSADY